MSRKRNHRMRSRDLATNSWAVALSNSQTLTEQKATQLMESTRVALVRMLDGSADDVHHQRLGTDINVAFIRLEDDDIEGEKAPTFEVLQLAGEALNFSARMRQERGRYGLTGPGRQQLADGIEAYEAILRASTPRQMENAQQELVRRHRALRTGKAVVAA
ncbi:MAG TPA: hypothetical protein VIL30_02615 [Ramlibacter sp.]|jgi:hypothetical protein